MAEPAQKETVGCNININGNIMNHHHNMIILSFLLSLPIHSSSFSPPVRLSITNNANGNGLPSITTGPAAMINISPWSPSSALMAKKRRRRKTASPAPTTQSDELPDFDDGEAESVEENPVQTSTPSSPSVVVSTSRKTKPSIKGGGLNDQLAEEVGGNVEGMDQDVIIEAMRGTAGEGSWQPPQSIQATLSDRSLEKLMDFDAMIERDGGGSGQAMELPDFDEVISRRKQQDAAQVGRVEDVAMSIDTQGLGKKAARNASRKAVAMQREAEIEAQKSPFEDILKDFSAVKLLENGAWVGIGCLVLWEFYINSPFFDRTLPMIPPVYNTPPGM
jgi:hypothetical protein